MPHTEIDSPADPAHHDREPPALTVPPRHEAHLRKNRVLTRGTPSITRTIADAVVLKDGDFFLLTEPDGRVPSREDHGFGLYYRDCRYLNTYELDLAGTLPVGLGATAEAGTVGRFQLTNADLQADGKTILHKEGISVRWQRRLDGTAAVLHDRILFRNWMQEPLELPVELRFRAEFEDVFEVRGLLKEHLGRLHPPKWSGGRLLFQYDGGDKVVRQLAIAFSSGFERAGPNSARAVVRLAPRGEAELRVELALSESSSEAAELRPAGPERLDLRIASDDTWLVQVVERSVKDLGLLCSSIHGHRFFSAGIPWFATLFGRDSLISALQILPYDPSMAAETLRLLAQYQGQRVDAWRDEQPGKILHELRRGEMVQAGAIPHNPYYGSVDATPLFLILLGEHAKWSGDLRLFEELRPNVERALEWMSRYGDSDGDGYIEYKCGSEHGLINQGWKDSGDAIMNADGSIATPPIALIEVQAYAYQARLLVADLYRRAGEEDRAAQLVEEAERLRRQFNRDFWADSLGCYVLALEADKRQAQVISSNPGHALWTGIADPEKGAATVNRLMAEDMFGGWGVRTLSSKERAYNPIGYHIGTVWPHENAIIAAGFRRYGFDDAARRICAGITDAAMYFEHARLPELFTGFSRAEYSAPIRYPVACHPQAWAAGATPHLLQTMLGLSADAFARRLYVTRPMLPDGADVIAVRGITVGDASVGLRFERCRDGSISVDELERNGDVEVVTGQPEPSASGAAR